MLLISIAFHPEQQARLKPTRQ